MICTTVLAAVTHRLAPVHSGARALLGISAASPRRGSAQARAPLGHPSARRVTLPCCIIRVGGLCFGPHSPHPPRRTHPKNEPGWRVARAQIAAPDAAHAPATRGHVGKDARDRPSAPAEPRSACLVGRSGSTSRESLPAPSALRPALRPPPPGEAPRHGRLGAPATMAAHCAPRVSARRPLPRAPPWQRTLRGTSALACARTRVALARHACVLPRACPSPLVTRHPAPSPRRHGSLARTPCDRLFSAHGLAGALALVRWRPTLG